MALDYDTLMHYRKNHPSWRLFMADNAAMVASFLDRTFRENNVRMVSETELILALDNYQRALSERLEGDPFPRTAAEYLTEWTGETRGWLRKFYPQGSDIPHYDLTPEAEKALSWMEQLSGSGFLGTEGRLNLCFDLLRQLVHGTEENRELRLTDLKKRRKAIEDEIARMKKGEFTELTDRELRERFMQFRQTARELLGDFRAVERNFLDLDSSIRAEITLWEGEKSELLRRILDRHDEITESDEGQSFNAFWDFIMHPASRDELEDLLDRVWSIRELGDLRDDRRLRRVHFDWISAGEQTQRRVAQLSSQLRRYLDDKAFWENRRIMDLLRSIEHKAASCAVNPPIHTAFTELSGNKCDLLLPMDYPLFSPPVTITLDSIRPETGSGELDMALLMDQSFVDRVRLESNIDAFLVNSSQASLATILACFPLEQGLLELVAYLLIATERTECIIDETVREQVSWEDKNAIRREAQIPLILFSRSTR